MIAVVSDSHVPRKASQVPGKVLQLVEEAGITVHCGDFETREAHDLFRDAADEFLAVMGNCDRFELDNCQSFEHRDVKLGVTHGKGITPRGHLPTLANIAEELDADVLFHGHTHRQEAVRHDDVILLNPGSCTGAPGGSYQGGNPEMMAAVEVDDRQLEVTLIELVDDSMQEEEKSFEL